MTPKKIAAFRLSLTALATLKQLAKADNRSQSGYLENWLLSQPPVKAVRVR